MSTFTLASADPVSHVINHPFWVVDGWWLWSSAQTNMVITALIMVFGGFIVAKAVSTGAEGDGHHRWVTKSRFAHTVEVICGYLRENTVRPLLHERTKMYMPFLWTVFFFILINNLLGLIPLLDAQNLLNPEMAAEHRLLVVRLPRASMSPRHSHCSQV